MIEQSCRCESTIEDFVAILGHDLRTPLHAVASSATLLRQTDLSEVQARSVARIASCAERMRRMIRDLLDVTRGRVGCGLPIFPRAADLSDICESVLDELRVIWPDRLIDFAVEAGPKGMWDVDRIAQVVSNLVGNALSYSSPSTPVRVRLRDERCAIRLEVQNDGAAISAAELARIFDPFHRGATNGHPRQGEGLGLGLYIVRLIVHAHGGEIGVSSTPEEGTTFAVRLPRHAAGSP